MRVRSTVHAYAVLKCGQDTDSETHSTSSHVQRGIRATKTLWTSQASQLGACAVTWHKNAAVLHASTVVLRSRQRSRSKATANEHQITEKQLTALRGSQPRETYNIGTLTALKRWKLVAKLQR
ncbi:hypothetical protein NDU88_005938 [Pleurodeles waltl]|uniref:Uncharacterized protein n=1 Tax=Pleurodeles waltl TaxID=8319 RepID=A0AAV7MG50_PLEWA|nr:hypothetical protein NDU88_005938 [Pleurodeles waltl]